MSRTLWTTRACERADSGEPRRGCRLERGPSAPRRWINRRRQGGLVVDRLVRRGPEIEKDSRRAGGVMKRWVIRMPTMPSLGSTYQELP
jgi:hypothetical protein